MRFLRVICQAAVGLALLFSGFVKLLDPVGTGLIIQEYCRFFSLGFLIPAATPLALLYACGNALTGIALLSGFRIRQAACVALALVGSLLLVSLSLALFRSGMGPGYRGVMKNGLLALMALFLFFQRGTIRPMGPAGFERTVLALFLLLLGLG